jgi:DNA-binding response OmpR family regulator
MLIVEDDPFLAKMLRYLLAEAGYGTTTLADPRQVLPWIADHRVNLVLLDVKMPHLDGFSLAGRVRQQYPNVPVIFLTACSLMTDKARGFEHGADDYLTKPFEPAELLARIQAVLRRYSHVAWHHDGAVIRVGRAMLDLSKLQFTAAGRPPVILTPTEMKILESLMRRAGETVTHEQLLMDVWGEETGDADNRVDVSIRRLRMKIEANPGAPRYIRTVRRAGFVFRDAGQVALQGGCSVA